MELKNLTDESFGYIVGKASLELGRRLNKLFRDADHPITTEQFSILIQLWEKDGRNQNELACLTSKDNPSVCRLLDNLEKNNIVLRVPSESDRRINMIYLTHKGRELEELSKEMAEQTLSEALKDVEENDIEICKSILSKVIYNLGNLEKNHCLNNN